MAFRVRNTDTLSFGIMAAAVAATHVRFRRASDDGQPVVHPLNATVNVAIGERLRLPANMLAVKYNSGDLPDAHMDEAIRDYWNGVSFEVDMMTSANAVVGDSAYSQQATDAWTFDTPADD